ncbi:NUDIX domain-containing protein [Streptosporangium soli]
MSCRSQSRGRPGSGRRWSPKDERPCELLLIRRSDSRNEALPGGATDRGESIPRAAIREETGITVISDARDKDSASLCGPFGEQGVLRLEYALYGDTYRGGRASYPLSASQARRRSDGVWHA